MASIAVVICIFATSIISMDLALAICWGRRANFSWSRYLIVFMATIMGAVFSYTFLQLTTIAFTGFSRTVVSLVFAFLAVLDAAFLIVFTPILINWIIARPMNLSEKILFSILSVFFVAMSVLGLFLDMHLRALLHIVFLILIIYTAALMIVSRRKIEERSVRNVTLTIMVVSLSMLPLLILSFIFTDLSSIFISLIALFYFVMIMVFLFIAIENQRKEGGSREEGMSSRMIEEYHITGREVEIINLIKKGLTNKEIASELSISVNTVNNHIANIFSKTDVRCRIDLLNLLKEASW
ncbi:MAG TPA: LuxR C-terminal-related transcriptional regulator [Candidatus Ornithospirochaeta avicola]|uniref:LuxR C-terminal-related transcriptional regulator n=1 Tax=Candidatus Ornithospirochaeta avicola TaxID=2840896 RepID=A0A9D1TNM9_9SPIO|nr:LuxR C-terminal-related transcriptional regulator [Candidatus Ornithospirochaeta avicola]